ncbi:MAG: hypothetical protein H7Y38_05530 [Armatimonadetes bacterium]|nr:hypothetical protein [Armatimonadota bacterium]
MTVGFALWFSVIGFLGCGLFYAWSCQIARRDISERVRAAARLVALEWQIDAQEKSATKALREAEEDMRLDNVAIFIVDDSGAVLGSNRTAVLSVSDMRRHRWIIAEWKTPSANVVAGMDWRATEAVLQKQALMLTAFALALSGAGTVAAWFLVGKTLRPIGVLADQAGVASADPLQARLQAPSNDAEVQHLVETLNGFLERFQQNTRAREQFYAAAAHELRTPLAVLSGGIELALSRPRITDDYVETLRDLQGETKRLIALSEALLTLNRLQTEVGAEEPEPVDIGSECERVLSALAPIIEKKRLIVSIKGGRECTETLAPLSQVTVLLRNLLENAAKYTPVGGAIRIVVETSATAICLRVHNDYPMADALPLDRFYEPFFRADPSRSLQGGNGLGLAICRRLAELHRWDLQHTSTDDTVIVQCVFHRWFFTPDTLF